MLAKASGCASCSKYQIPAAAVQATDGGVYDDAAFARGAAEREPRTFQLPLEWRARLHHHPHALSSPGNPTQGRLPCLNPADNTWTDTRQG